MALSKEWNNRIILWMNELKNHFYRELGEVAFSGHVTSEQLDLLQALNRTFLSMPEGTRWGAAWEYGWFKGRVLLPNEATGKRIVLMPDLGGEGTVFVNSLCAGAIDKEHHVITLCMEGIPGESFDIVAECYAGHGPRLENMPPVPPEKLKISDLASVQAVVGKSSFGIWEEEAYQLWMDVSTLYQIRSNINVNSLRVAEIDKGLKDFTLIVDFELEQEARNNTFKACRERLRPLLQCVNGSTAPLMAVFGQSHLDLAWLWPLAETERKCARTVSNQLALMAEYPEYRFLLTQPPIYLILKNKYPELYQRVGEKITEGRIMPEGGMWVQADTNLPGGESLIRQLIYGKKFFRDEFGIDSELLWLPDTFGFSASLPQIMKGCRIKYFCTKKLLDNYNGGDPFPYNLFMWEGIDGSRILSHLIRKCNSPIDPQILISRWEVERNQKDGISGMLFPFGFGDGGGGPVRDHLEYALRLKDLEGAPRTKMSHPNQFFRDVEADSLPEQKYVGELYFQAHRGTYTSQAKTKKSNRLSEIALREVEFWCTAAKILCGVVYPYDTLDKAWKKVLFNQFHDIIAGASIRRVHEEAEQDFQEVLDLADGLKKSMFSCMVTPANGKLTVFNSLSWTRSELLVLPPGFEAVCSPDGEIQPAQVIEGRVYAEITVPPCGWTTLQSVGETKAIPNTLKVTERCLENDLLRIEFNVLGEIIRIYDKETGLELASGPCNSYKMYKDVTTCYDAWDIDSMYERLPVELPEKAIITVVSRGPLVAAVQIQRKLNQSMLRQEVSLRRGSRRVEFKTTVDWQENHKLLKVNFPVNLHSHEGIHEIQFGHIRRPNHHSRSYDADRFEVCNHKWTALAEGNRGFAILNDSKYGVNVFDGNINLTLLKSALAPDMQADRGIQEFTYAFYVWNGPFIESGVVREAYELNYRVAAFPGSAGECSLFQVDRPEIVIETIKPAEDRSGDLIVRLYESMNTTTKTFMHTASPVIGAEQTNMLEEVEKELTISDGQIELEFRPFEIKTIRLKTT